MMKDTATERAYLGNSMENHLGTVRLAGAVIHRHLCVSGTVFIGGQEYDTQMIFHGIA